MSTSDQESVRSEQAVLSSRDAEVVSGAGEEGAAIGAAVGGVIGGLLGGTVGGAVGSAVGGYIGSKLQDANLNTSGDSPFAHGA